MTTIPRAAPHAPAPNERARLAKMVMTLCRVWKLSQRDQATLLGLNAGNRSALYRYRTGVPLGSTRDQMDRMHHLLAIHRSLRTLFPQNKELAYRWMSSRNRAFENMPPVEMIEAWGFSGLLRVRTYLDRACAQ